jgi:hypothetical protein
LATLNDPMVESGGVEVGFSPRPEMLRAPDVAIGGVTGSATWEKGVPSLAIEYADAGQDEADLKRKIAELLREGTKLVWVVRLVGPLRVEVHERGQPVRIALPGDELEAPGILANAVPVAALFDKDEARRADLRNLLERFGYGSVEKIRAEGRAAAVLRVLQTRELTATESQRDSILACADAALLDQWIARAVTCSSVDELFD